LSLFKIDLPSDVLKMSHSYTGIMKNIRVLIADDASRVREDLRTLLTLSGNIDVVGEARDGAEAVRQVETLRPEIVLLDLEMPVLDGIEAARRIKTAQPSCRVIVLTIHGGQAERQRAFSAGADYFQEKGAPLETLLAAIYGKDSGPVKTNGPS
jgi:DNA-binding NarL/FixJ family response regulator